METDGVIEVETDVAPPGVTGARGRGAERGAARRIVEFDGAAWVVRSLSGERVSLRTPDRGTAVARAKEIVRHLGGGEVEVRDKSGGPGKVASVPAATRQSRR